MADSVASVYVFHAIFLCKFIAFVEMSRIVHLACRNEVVVDQNDFIRVPQFGKAHLLEFIADKRDEDIMNHDSVHVDRHNVARFYVFSGVVADDFFNYCIAHRFFLPLLIQSVALAHCLYQAACLNDIHQVLRQSCDRVCFSVVINMLIHLDGDGVALFDIVVQIRLLDQKKAVIDGVAEKDPSKGFRDNAGNAERLDDLRCLLSRGAAAEVLSCHDDVALFNLSGQFRAERGKAVLFHIVNCL